MKVKYLVSLLAVFGFSFFPTKGQCDLVLTDVDIEEGTFTIEFLNTTNCGGTGGPDGVSEIQIGFQALDPDNDCAAINQGWTFPSGITTSNTSNHPGWVFSSTSSETLNNWTNGWDDWAWDIDPPYYAGETITFPLYNQYEQDCVNGPFANNLSCQLEDALDFWLDEGLSIQAVIWQISYGPTMYADNGGWAEVGGLGDGITPPCCGLYEDDNFLDNWIIIGPCNESFIPGCTDPFACNFDSLATDDDGSCVYCDETLCDSVPSWCYGCLDPVALNYDEDSQIDDGSCVYSVGPDLVPINVEVIEVLCFDTLPITFFRISITLTNIGTMDVVDWCATTFLSQANYQCPNADVAVGDTITVEATFPATWNSGQPNYLEVDFVEGPDGFPEIVTGNNILPGWTMPDYVDCAFIIEGCTNPCANNYNPDATEDNGSCEYDVIIDSIYVELPPDTITIIDVIDSLIYITDTLYVELPPDTIIELQIDTIYVPWEWYIYDTVYVDNYIYDTTYVEIIVDNYIYDTTYIEVQLPPDTIEIQLPPDTITIVETEFIFETDTIFETEIVYITDSLYITLVDTIIEYQFIEIDCSTGLPCGDLGFEECDPLVVYIPNTFTPNNDGVNDVWEVILEPNCWTEVEVRVFNRWGDLVFESFDPYYLSWNGSYMGGGSYVPDGVYYWTFSGRKINTTVIEELQGHVTIFR
jgi:gliding motility-associated-like protein